MIHNIHQLSKTISTNLKRNNIFCTSTYILDKFYKNHLIHNHTEVDFKNELLSHQQYNEYNYKKHILYNDDLLETLLIEWKPDSYSPVHDHSIKGCVMMLLNGDIKEKRYHPDTKIFQYERNLMLGVSTYIDDYNHLHSIHNMSDKSSYTLHMYPKHKNDLKV